MKKAVIVINGTGGSGKDTVAEVVLKKFCGLNVSSIDLPKQLLTLAGWDGKKTPEARKALSEIKQALTEFNDAPFNYCKEYVQKFKEEVNCPFLFVHIRERENIDRFHEYVIWQEQLPCFDLLVVGNPTTWGNPSDDKPENFVVQDYDIVLYNNSTKEDLEAQALETFDKLMYALERIERSNRE